MRTSSTERATNAQPSVQVLQNKVTQMKTVQQIKPKNAEP